MEAQKDPAQVSTDRYKKQQILLIYHSPGHESASPPSDLHRGLATLLSFTDNAGAQDLGGSAALLTSLPLKELAFGKTG